MSARLSSAVWAWGPLSLRWSGVLQRLGSSAILPCTHPPARPPAVHPHATHSGPTIVGEPTSPTDAVVFVTPPPNNPATGSWTKVRPPVAAGMQYSQLTACPSAEPGHNQLPAPTNPLLQHILTLCPIGGGPCITPSDCTVTTPAPTTCLVTNLLTPQTTYIATVSH